MLKLIIKLVIISLRLLFYQIETAKLISNNN